MIENEKLNTSNHAERVINMYRVTKLYELFKIIRKLILWIKDKYELSRYNDYNIGDYFRKQGAMVGDDCFIAVRSLGPEPFLVKIDNHVCISANVLFITHNIGWTFRKEIPDLQVFGKIILEDNCTIGPNSIILPGITVGKNSIVGAGSVVTKDVPPDVVVAGNPARIITGIEKYKEKAIHMWKQQKPQGYFGGVVPNESWSSIELYGLKLRDFNLLRRHLIKLFWGKDHPSS